ncbi:S-adenosyl-L-methionine-dependent methyltransferase [Gilbertella persicaria]|uniref:S-adenosyl-L-methionine-dependent methyltransferase n=1 Tax=Gilbertella persicaria TaxID=101096 RepID=UPI00221EB048|nr:S-adenosyl-L-methionine-dependent methyltransferase [Gilbertella persicaria]KAI8047286.1 S-adenosyl-L-methionine-dependent methyltransferase [Gilbertella persicaria]
MPFSVRHKSNQTKSASHSISKSLSSSRDIASQVFDDEDDGPSATEPKFPLRHQEFIEGRNYRKSKKPNEQFLPCDDEEIERLQINHLMFRSLFASPFFSPVGDLLKSGIRVLDVGAGPAWWLMDMAKEYPQSYFVGVDVMVYPISPPVNCHLKIHDISKGLPFPDNSFDFVTQHDALFRYCQKDWETILPEIIRVVKPGGYIEFVEPSGVVQDIGPNMSIWMMRLTVSLQTRSINLKIASQLQSMLEAFTEIELLESSHRSAPIGWYGKTGDIMLECMERLFDAIKPKLSEDWSMSPAKYDKMAQTASSECRDFRSWVNIHYAYARKQIPSLSSSLSS